MKKILAFLAVFFNVMLGMAQEKYSIGEILELDSKILNEKRILNIYLPTDYKKEETYDVIYLLDGSSQEDFLHVVGLVQFFDLQLKMPKTIVVGISNVDRKRDFTFPTTIEKDKKDFPTTGGSAKFIEFLEIELQPFLSSRYNFSENKYLIGQSLGGLLASEILIKKPNLFSHYLIVSPSFWWDNESLLKSSKELMTQNNYKNTYVFLAVGKEHPVMIKESEKFSKILKDFEVIGLKSDYIYLPKENHATILHTSLYEAFKKLFPYKE